VEKRTFKNIRIEILKLNGLPYQYKSDKMSGVKSDNPVKVVLHFRRVEKKKYY
jgi:hypothetical protein